MSGVSHVWRLCVHVTLRRTLYDVIRRLHVAAEADALRRRHVARLNLIGLFDHLSRSSNDHFTQLTAVRDSCVHDNLAVC